MTAFREDWAPASRLKAVSKKSTYMKAAGGGKIDEDIYEELETILLTADVGVGATQALLEQVRALEIDMPKRETGRR